MSAYQDELLDRMRSVLAGQAAAAPDLLHQDGTVKPASPPDRLSRGAGRAGQYPPDEKA